MRTGIRVALLALLLAPAVGAQQEVAASSTTHSTKRAHPEFIRGRADATGAVQELYQECGGYTAEFYARVDEIRQFCYECRQEAVNLGMYDDVFYWDGQLNVWNRYQ
ncbi:hypothetical protein [Hymenobacter pini]|uniref:hypothetical protein n=1 Tax=Hymenobacter pini TaxID=2880879 RepID=UPI001CF3E95F|nr:hypothetical protein [Hymenobacter pini]MCA8830320.1 hypothetical protein [Hymenobacter pini]